LVATMSMLGKLVIVTGASSGIGRAAAIALAGQGASVACLGRNMPNLEEAVSAAKEEQKKQGGDAAIFGCECDVTSEESVKKAVEESLSKFSSSKIDSLVNCAGVLIGGATQATSVETFDTNFNVNTRGTFLLMHHCLPHFNEEGGSIVNVSSVTGLQSFAGTFAYCASKAAVDMMTKCAAVDLAEKKIRVNAINPGVIKTELQKRGGLTDEVYKQFLERSKVTHPLGRVGQPEEVAELITFLCSDKSSFITGTSIPIDGGRLCLGAR